MDGAAIAVEEIGLGEDMGAGAQRADIRTLSVGAAQMRKDVLIIVEVAVDAAAQNDRVEIDDLLDRALRVEGDAVRGADRLAVRREEMPGIEFLAGDAVGEAQWLDRRGESNHREIRHQQKSYFLRRLDRHVPEHCSIPSLSKLRPD